MTVLKNQAKFIRVCPLQLRRIKTEEKAKVVTAVWGTELIQIFSTRMILKKRINRIKATWRKKCFKKNG